jgi:hypothetical protein
VLGKEIISVGDLVNLLPMHRENLVLNVVEEQFYYFWLRLLMLESDQLQTCLSII